MDLSHIDLPRYLSVLPPFEGLAPEALLRLASACELRCVDRLGVVFRVGEPCPAMTIVVAGQVKLFATSHEGQEKVVELLGPGSTLAEASVFTGDPHLLSAEALTDTVLLAIEKQRVVAEIGADPGFALRMLTSVSRRLHGLMEGVQADALHSGLQRVVSFLLRHHQAGSSVSLPVSKATIASLLSVTPEYLSRILRTLASAQLIQVDRRDIRILDARRLATFPPAHGPGGCGRAGSAPGGRHGRVGGEHRPQAVGQRAEPRRVVLPVA
jgi:CRP/FNR family transcriptional regulator, dissimilatory nitrate respiration regulator